MDHRIEDVERALRDWRRDRPTKEMPEELWQRAAAVARRDGLTKTATRLRLNFARLKERCERRSREREKSADFVELAPSELSLSNESIVELESENGSRLRLVLRGASVAAVTAAAKELWSVMR